MTRSKKSIFFLLVVGVGIYGCAKNPSGSTSSENKSSQEAKAHRWEEDFKAAAAARDQYRQKLHLAEERQVEIQKQLEQERINAANERDALKGELKTCTNERDSLHAQYDGFRKSLKDLLAQAESSMNPTVPNIPTIPVIPTTSTPPALLGSQPDSTVPTTPGSTLNN